MRKSGLVASASSSSEGTLYRSRAARLSSLANQVRSSVSRSTFLKTCMALVNGAVEYTCIAKLTPDVTTVEPLPRRQLIRDLVTDILPVEEKFSG